MDCKKIFLLIMVIACATAKAQDTIRYTGKTLVNVDYHHGQLAPAVGVHNIQVMRASREHPDQSDGFGWTYNHAPMLAYHYGQFFLEYLSNPVGEHVQPGQTLLVTSKDGYTWSKPVVIFPPYKIPDGTTKPGSEKKAQSISAVMHQRMGFYVSKNNKFLALGYYGIALDEKDDPNDGNGIGRVVREILPDGKFGPIYFIRYNHAFNKSNTNYPPYTDSKDKNFVAACDELLANRLMMQQWNEEADRDDPLITLKNEYKAFCFYHLPDKRVVGLWKHALTSISADEGKSWKYNPLRAPGFVNSNAKIWGQRTSDGKYATVYNPSEFRWPLAVSVSDDGLNYKNLLLVNGEIASMRYGGNYKSYGPQYVRGIQEGDGTPPDQKMWVSYSMNKEDIWVASIPVPVTDKVDADVNDFENLKYWNIYSPLWAPVLLQDKALVLRDKDPFDYAKAERVVPTAKKMSVEFEIMAEQDNHGLLDIEFQNSKGDAGIRLAFDSAGAFKAKAGYRYRGLGKYEKGKRYKIIVELNTANRMFTVNINGKQGGNNLFFAPLESVSRIVFRTGDVRRFPDADTPTDQMYDLQNTGGSVPEAKYKIYYLKTKRLDGVENSNAVLEASDYKHYVDLFNKMEDENIAQAIPNAQSWEWMQKNIPLFECPQQNFEEIYYYRWWTYRKHIKQTPAGFAFTEFLVNRSYADKYNLISCAVGHHVYEGRWLHDQQYLDQYLHVWYRGNEGKPLPKLRNFSNWNADAVYNRYLVNSNSDYMLNMLPDLQTDYAAWETEKRLPNGLFWQFDVRDGMEESISGARREKNARPTINSYMYGNAIALAKMATMAGKNDLASLYKSKADSIKQLTQQALWNARDTFFETRKQNDQPANVREAIGFIPWYFNLPAAGYEPAWKKLMDEKGFLSPFGLTTAERSHPEFRTHGCCNCEWDGAVWPFATSQTMTAMANLLNHYEQSFVSRTDYFRLMELFVESQYYRGRPYVGEYLDEKTGYWLKGDQERSRYYNHSTFCDLVITGLVGLRPRADNIIEVNPLIPENKWDWFCLDNVLYHGKKLSIIWDKDGTRYYKGKGFSLWVNGKKMASSEKLTALKTENK